MYTIEFYENVMDMIWLLACKDVDNDVAEEIYTEIIKLNYQNHRL